jgi:hypothetical protein
VASVSGAVGSVTGGVTITTNNDKTGYALSAAGIDSIWDELGARHTTVGSFAEWLNGAKDSSGNYSGIESLIRINR